MRTVILCLGNDLLADDGIGIFAADRLRRELTGTADVVATAQSGLALMDHLIGYDRAIIVDAIHTGKQPAGQVYRLSPCDLSATCAPSPHYAGLPEMLAIADRLAITFPSDVELIAVEVTDTHTIGGAISGDVMESLDALVEEVYAVLAGDRMGTETNA